MQLFRLATLLLLVLKLVNSQVGTCSIECGGNNEFSCADFLEKTSSPDKCYSCAPGFVGGSGFVNGTGAPCKKGKCRDECSACKTENDATQCYLCSNGYYDPTKDATKATPCEKCHPTCSSCAGPLITDCLICNYGYYDSLASPYLPGQCDKCDTKCSQCRFSRDNCVKGCCAQGFKKESPVSYNCVRDC